jgi:uncharacterized DUF497 family protein
MDELELEWDPHSTDEDRYATIGTTDRGRLLVVISTPRGRRTRLTTAWPATPAERREYEQNKARRSRYR